jgi:hypothetical protein
MKKTFCDCCEEQCINTTVLLRIDVIHHTNDGQFVGEDDYKAIEICLNCSNMIKEMMPQAFIISHAKEEMSEMAEAPPVRVNMRME